MQMDQAQVLDKCRKILKYFGSCVVQAQQGNKKMQVETNTTSTENKQTVAAVKKQSRLSLRQSNRHEPGLGKNSKVKSILSSGSGKSSQKSALSLISNNKINSSAQSKVRKYPKAVFSSAPGRKSMELTHSFTYKSQTKQKVSPVSFHYESKLPVKKSSQKTNPNKNRNISRHRYTINQEPTARHNNILYKQRNSRLQSSAESLRSKGQLSCQKNSERLEKVYEKERQLRRQCQKRRKQAAQKEDKQLLQKRIDKLVDRELLLISFKQQLRAGDWVLN